MFSLLLVQCRESDYILSVCLLQSTNAVQESLFLILAQTRPIKQ